MQHLIKKIFILNSVFMQIIINYNSLYNSLITLLNLIFILNCLFFYNLIINKFFSKFSYYFRKLISRKSRVSLFLKEGIFSQYFFY